MKRMLSLTATALALTLSLAGCGTDDEPVESAAAAQSAPDEAGGPGGRPGSGKVAAVDGSTAQVQGAGGQTAVSWTGSTTFTQEVAGGFDDVTKGACVLVAGEGDEDAVTATSVRITPAVDGECAGPGGRGERPGDLPTDRPSDAPSGAPRGEGPAGGMTVGTVTAVTGDGFTVESSGVDDGASVTVSVTEDTTFTATQEADASAVEVGVCVQAQGEPDSAGAVSATSIAISAATDGECSNGFGGRPGGPRGGDDR